MKISDGSPLPPIFSFEDIIESLGANNINGLTFSKNEGEVAYRTSNGGIYVGLRDGAGIPNGQGILMIGNYVFRGLFEKGCFTNGTVFAGGNNKNQNVSYQYNRLGSKSGYFDVTIKEKNAHYISSGNFTKVGSRFIPNGECSILYANGENITKLNGLFNQGVLKEANIIYPNRYSYSGSFAANLRHGLGELKDPLGRVYVGGFVNGKKHGEGLVMDMINDNKVFFKVNYTDDKLDTHREISEAEYNRIRHRLIEKYHHRDIEERGSSMSRISNLVIGHGYGGPISRDNEVSQISDINQPNKHPVPMDNKFANGHNHSHGSHHDHSHGHQHVKQVIADLGVKGDINSPPKELLVKDNNHHHHNHDHHHDHHHHDHDHHHNHVGGAHDINNIDDIIEVKEDDIPQSFVSSIKNQQSEPHRHR